LEKGLNLALEIDNKPNIAHFYDTLGAVYQWYGKYDTALDYIQKANSLFDEIGIIQLISKSRVGFHYFFIGELDKAIKILDEIIPKLLESESKRWRCYGNWQNGLINWLKGNLDVAIESIVKAVKIAEGMNDRYHIDLFNVFLAAVYFDKGNYDQTMKLCLQSIKSSYLHQEKYTIAFANYLLGKVYHIKGDFNLAWDYAHKGLQQRKEMDAIHHTIESLFSLILILIDKNDLTQAKKYFDELTNYVEKKPTKRFLLIEKISQAIIQKASTRPRLWIKAIDILEEVVNEEIADHSLTVIALINLCELLINEFSFSGDSEVLMELENYTELLESIAKEQKTYYLRLEAGNIRILTMWLKAQYSIVDIDLQKAKDLLHEAQTMADEEGLTRLAEKITNQQGRFLERIDRWDDFIKKYYEFIKG
jgi:tetratricopeptide (TPR) repeat protein